MAETHMPTNGLAAMESAIEAFERGLDEYQVQLHSWFHERRAQLGRDTAEEEERSSARLHQLEERSRQLDRDREALAQDRAALERFRGELNALAAEHEQRGRTTREQEESLRRKLSLQDEAIVSLQEQTDQLDQRKCELQQWYEDCAKDLEARKGALAAAEGEFADVRKRFDGDRQELVGLGNELARREHELASQADANRELQEKLAERTRELDAGHQTLSSERENVAALHSQIERRAAELSSLEAQLESQQTEIETRAHALEDGTQQLKKQSSLLGRQERELQQAAAKNAALQQKASNDLERRERELADATRDLSDRTERLEADRREIESQKQTVQAAVLKLKQHEQELAEAQSEWAERQATLKDVEKGLRGREMALQAERGELSEERKSAEADLAAKRQKLAQMDAESSARLDQVQRDQKSVEKLDEELHRRGEEIERRAKALADREGELNGQQAKLKAAMQNMRDDRAALEKARGVVAEVEESRSNELNKVRAELNTMRTEIESARSRVRELEGSLGKSQAANMRETHAAEAARAETARLAEQLEYEKRTVAEQQEWIKRREQEIHALLAKAEAESAGSTASRPDGGALLLQRQMSHTAVASFWADFKLPPAGTEDNLKASKGTDEAGVEKTTAGFPSGSSEIADAEKCASGMAPDRKDSAKCEGLAAASTTVEAVEHKKSNVLPSGSEGETPSSLKKQRMVSGPVRFTREMAQKPGTEPEATRVPSASKSIDLDPETANRLRLMRRLNPSLSDQELLAKISQEDLRPAKTKAKRGWFSLR